ncbi:unnamed protein product, partial [Laminaria digitata]
KVVLRAVCVVVVAGVGETELLLHLLTSFGPFKKYWEAVVSQHKSQEHPHRRRGSRRRASVSRRRSNSLSPIPVASRNTGLPKKTFASSGALASTLATATAIDTSAMAGPAPPHRPQSTSSITTAAVAAAAVARLREDEERRGEEEEAGAGRGAGVRAPRGAAGLFPRKASPRATAAAAAAPAAPAAAGDDSGGAAAVAAAAAAAADAAAAAAAEERTRSGLEVLRSCLGMLEAGGFLRVCEGGETFICEDVMLIDQVYASTPFKLRKGLHKEAAKWIAERHRRSFRDRADVMPVLINHLTQAHEEARAQAMLAVLKV